MKNVAVNLNKNSPVLWQLKHPKKMKFCNKNIIQKKRHRCECSWGTPCGTLFTLKDPGMKCGPNTNFRNKLINMKRKYECSSTREVNFVNSGS